MPYYIIMKAIYHPFLENNHFLMGGLPHPYDNSREVT
jgi:hypothetical protein